MFSFLFFGQLLSLTLGRSRPPSAQLLYAFQDVVLLLEKHYEDLELKDLNWPQVWIILLYPWRVITLLFFWKCTPIYHCLLDVFHLRIQEEAACSLFKSLTSVAPKTQRTVFIWDLWAAQTQKKFLILVYRQNVNCSTFFLKWIFRQFLKCSRSQLKS